MNAAIPKRALNIFIALCSLVLMGSMIYLVVSNVDIKTAKDWREFQEDVCKQMINTRVYNIGRGTWFYCYNGTAILAQGVQTI